MSEWARQRSQKRPIFSKKRPIFSQKNPISYVLPKDIYLTIIYVGMSATTPWKETCILTKETYILTKETCILTKETCILTKETYIRRPTKGILRIIHDGMTRQRVQKRPIFPQKSPMSYVLPKESYIPENNPWQNERGNALRRDLYFRKRAPHPTS